MNDSTKQTKHKSKIIKNTFFLFITILISDVSVCMKLPALYFSDKEQRDQKIGDERKQRKRYFGLLIDSLKKDMDFPDDTHSLGFRFLFNYDQPPLRGKNQTKSFITRKERAKLKLLKLPKTGWNYNELDSLRNMWKEYMRQNLDLIDGNHAPDCASPEWASFSTILAKSELIGAEITIVKSNSPTLVGMTGTIVYETKMTIQIVTPQSKLKVILKENAVFEFRLDRMKFTIYGKHIMTRSADRSTKKFKGAPVPQL